MTLNMTKTNKLPSGARATIEETKPRVLIVDDDSDIRDVLGLYLKYEGYDPVFASNGKEALEAIADETPDLMLLDLIMPGMSGIEVLLRQQELYPFLDLPVVVVTGRNETKDHVHALQCGAVDFIEKPINFSVLGARVFAHISRKLAKEELAATNEHLEELVLEKTMALEVEREYLSAVLDNTQDGIIACDENGLPILFNKSASKMLGIENSLSLLVPMITNYKLFDADGVTPLTADNSPLHRAFEDDSFSGSEIVVRHSDEEARIVNTCGRAMRDKHGKKLGAVISLHDITDYRQSQHVAEDYERRYHQLLANAPMMMHSIDAEGYLLEVSDHWLGALGYTREEVIHEHISRFLAPPAEGSQDDVAWAASKEKAFEANWTVCFLHKEGHRYKGKSQCIIDKDEDGVAIRTVEFTTDLVPCE